MNATLRPPDMKQERGRRASQRAWSAAASLAATLLRRMTTGRVSDQADDRREAFRLGPRRPGRSGRLDRPAPRATWREPAALAFHGSAIRFYDPVIDAGRSPRIEPCNG